MVSTGLSVEKNKSKKNTTPSEQFENLITGKKLAETEAKQMPLITSLACYRHFSEKWQG